METLSEMPILAPSWCYLYVRRGMEYVTKALTDNFPTFVHTNIVYHREKKSVSHRERPTIPGLLFVQGEPKVVQAFLIERYPSIRLARDCATNQVAEISDSVMQAFMKTTQIDPTRIRFMQHELEYYAEGHQLVRIVSGPLAGFEGYCIRISRDRCLVTSLGGITISIGHINRETFENIHP